MSARSFGRPEPEEKTTDEAQQLPTPVLHVGEVHAELRLVITDETLRDLGSQIASMIATAAKQGFEHGMSAAMEQMEADAGPDGEEPAVAMQFTATSNHASGPAVDFHLSDKDIERVRRAT
jgi:hypothetical protein